MSFANKKEEHFAMKYISSINVFCKKTEKEKRSAHRGARTPDHQVKSLALYRLS